MTCEHEEPAVVQAGRGYRFSASFVPDLLAVIDIVLLLAAGVIAYAIYVPYHASLLEYYVFCTGFVAGTTVLMLSRSGMYELVAIMRPVAKSDLVIVSVVSAFLFFLTIAFSLKVSGLYSRVWIYTFAALATVLLLVGRIGVAQVLRRLAERRVIGRNLVVLGTGREAERFLDTFKLKSPYFTDIVGVFEPRCSAGARAGRPAPEGEAAEPARLGSHAVLGDAEALLDYARSHRVDDIIIAMPLTSDGPLQTVIEQLKELPVNVYICSQLMDYQLRFHPALGYPRELPLFEVVQRPISGWSALLKTLEDYVIATLLLILLAPLLLLIAIVIRIDSPGPVFFMQRRLGFNNKEFKIYKFRSMHHREVPERVVQQARKDDPRITRVGRFIRRTSLDELPQLFNVLNGTMSLVGPRPHALSHNEEYGQRIRGYFARHKVKPGITGWAQINNLRGETESLSKMEARVEYDIYYAENWSLLFDLRILLVTLFVVLFQKTAY
ncbi:undecaprenyl-phosphate glucose phosphotransferase [Paralimibaculum aggregatum]|uniref:Undecaprenyl-phosphate glucose phosphotransferase n=1 Tax=Paralimibaculum aggregatum TaxID=3036245 RepID=A0ABQ6LQN0_9RHOB|nr:undecaprenyl-phosphate glucose phosphotransferase [Limibaculum sp. NKW23]GMG83264.1 undecaprenyl-phosphate glucose phosphotransferase [Limibaculum sp. NKW23]